jgi:hypothetical protein
LATIDKRYKRVNTVSVPGGPGSKETREMARKMTAKYPGCCRGCGEGIDPGERIVHAGRKKNYHAHCYDGRAYDGPAKAAQTPEVEAAPVPVAAPAFGENYEAADGFAWGGM